MSLQELCLFLVTILTSTTGQVFLKVGALQLGRVTSSNAVSHILGILTNLQILVGLALYGLSAVLYILILTRVNLSVAGPAVAIGYIFSVAIGYFVFREALPVHRVAGLGLIVAGVILVVWKR